MRVIRFVQEMMLRMMLVLAGVVIGLVFVGGFSFIFGLMFGYIKVRW